MNSRPLGPEPSALPSALYPERKRQRTGCRYGCGRRIRTLTIRVRVAGATITQFRIAFTAYRRSALLLYGIFTFITVLVGFRAGFSFSAGATDLIFSASLPAAKNTWMILPLGIAAFVVFYVVFRFMITKFDLKTPGREDDDDDAEKGAKLENNDYTEVARIVLEGVGGKENIESIDNCITRLRLEIRDYTKVDEKKIKSAGVAGVVRPSQKTVQVIIGTQVQFVADEFKKLCK